MRVMLDERIYNIVKIEKCENCVYFMKNSRCNEYRYYLTKGLGFLCGYDLIELDD
jgi:hypothetical protein